VINCPHRACGRNTCQGNTSGIPEISYIAIGNITCLCICITWATVPTAPDAVTPDIVNDLSVVTDPTDPEADTPDRAIVMLCVTEPTEPMAFTPVKATD
jgi:hypothetical protein